LDSRERVIPRNLQNASGAGKADARRIARILIAVAANLPPVSVPVMERDTAPISNFLVTKLFGACNFKKLELVTSFMSDDVLETVDAVMDALGGNQPVAGLTSSKPSAVSMWRKAESFPSNTYLALTEALREKGKTAPASLWGMKIPAESETAT
jgi:hypothetical protein